MVTVTARKITDRNMTKQHHPHHLTGRPPPQTDQHQDCNQAEKDPDN